MCFRRCSELKQEAQKCTVQHRNVVSLKAVVFEPENYGLVFDYAEYGCMPNFIQNHHVRLHSRSNELYAVGATVVLVVLIACPCSEGGNRGMAGY